MPLISSQAAVPAPTERLLWTEALSEAEASGSVAAGAVEDLLLITFFLLCASAPELWSLRSSSLKRAIVVTDSRENSEAEDILALGSYRVLFCNCAEIEGWASIQFFLEIE